MTEGFCCDRCGQRWGEDPDLGVGWIVEFGDDGFVSSALCPADQSSADQ